MLDEEPSGLEGALKAARERGRMAMKAVVNSDEMLGEEAAALMMDCPLPNLLSAHQAGFVLGLPYGGSLFFPDWQFRYDGQPFDEIAEVITLFDKSAWEVYRFLKAEHPALDGQTGIEVMRMSREPRLRPVAENWIEGGYA